MRSHSNPLGTNTVYQFRIRLPLGSQTLRNLIESSLVEKRGLEPPATTSQMLPSTIDLLLDFFSFIVYILYTKIKEKSNFKWPPKPFCCWLALSCDRGGWILLCAPPYTPLSQLSWWAR